MDKQKSTRWKVWLSRGLSACVLAGMVWLIMFYTAKINLYKYDKILVLGNEYVPTEEIREVVSSDSNENIISIDLKSIRQQVEGLDYVKSARISRSLPSTIRIDVIEREPFAFLKSSEGLWVIDRDGMILPGREYINSNFSIPALSGKTEELTLAEIRKLKQDSWFTTGMEFIRTVETQLPEFYSQCRWITLDEDEISFRHRKGTTHIKLNSRELDSQFIKLKSFSVTVENIRQLSDYQLIDLSVPGQIIVKELNRNS